VFIEAVREHGCHVEVGSMSSLVTGDSQHMFDALRQAYGRVASASSCVLIVKVRNVCPV